MEERKEVPILQTNENTELNQPESEEEKKSKKLETRMKEYEKQYIPSIPPNTPFLVRLDGHKFSKFTKTLDKTTSPFDINFVRTMVLTMNDLVKEFNAQTGYTHSDEITIIFGPMDWGKAEEERAKERVHIFNGRTVKIATLMAGYASTRFNFHLIAQTSRGGEYSKAAREKIESMLAYFDGRVMTFPFHGEFINHMLWRLIFDCNRNAISTYSRALFGHKQTNNKKSAQMKEMMLKEKNFCWEKDVPMYLRHGVYGKKKLYQVMAYNPKEEKEVEVVRSSIKNRSFKINYDEGLFIPMLFDKYWPEVIYEQTEAFEIDS